MIPLSEKLRRQLRKLKAAATHRPRPVSAVTHLSTNQPESNATNGKGTHRTFFITFCFMVFACPKREVPVLALFSIACSWP